MTERRISNARKDFARAFLALSFALLASPATAAPLHVMLDPGHGGIDRGAVRGPLKEAEIALKVTMELAQLLKADPRFQVSMTRTTDVKVALARRTEMAHEAKADVFMSVHLNSSTDTRARGKEIYFQNQMPADEDAMFLASHENSDEDSAPVAKESKSESLTARSDLKRILEDLHRNDRILSSSRLSHIVYQTWEAKIRTPNFGSRAIRQAPFQVVSSITIPSVLVEIGFISHPQEGPLLAQTDTQKQIARSLYEGLLKYKETVDNEATETLKSPLTE